MVICDEKFAKNLKKKKSFESRLAIFTPITHLEGLFYLFLVIVFLSTPSKNMSDRVKPQKALYTMLTWREIAELFVRYVSMCFTCFALYMLV